MDNDLKCLLESILGELTKLNGRMDETDARNREAQAKAADEVNAIAETLPPAFRDMAKAMIGGARG